jgi:putative sterol carrier protein
MPTTEDLIAQMQAQAGKLKRLGYRIRFDLTDTDESILLDGTAGAGEITAATSADEADTVLMLTADNLAKLIAGKLSPMLAFATGKLKVEGSKGVAMKMASLLDED